MRRWAGWLQLAIHSASLVPLASLLWDGTHNHLTANPIQAITFRTGDAALRLLIFSMACTPANRLLGWRFVVPWRRPLGLYGFFYATLHFLTFSVVDYGLDWRLIQNAIIEKRYVLAGFSAFILLIPLAITSTKGWQRRLGKRWTGLHRLVYVALPLAILHYVWLVKADIREPLLYGAAVAALLLLRWPPLRRALARLRSSLTRTGRVRA